MIPSSLPTGAGAPIIPLSGNSGCGCNCGLVTRAGISWSAIFAGVSAAIALQILFMMLGAGLGFALYSPITDTNPVAELGRGAVVIQGISAVVALWLGGWVAGRLAPVGLRAQACLHGLIVWCAATVGGVLFVAVGAGWALGDLSKLVGGGLSLAGRPAATLAGGAGELAKDALKQSGDALASFSAEALGHRPAGSAANLTVRAQREVGLAVARLFNPLATGAAAEKRAAVVKALVDHAGLADAAAEQAVAEWTVTYDRLKADWAAARADAEAKARALADQAAGALAMFSLCAFAGFVLGAAAASWGGRQGAACALRRDVHAEA